ncbi:hypothetical protein ACL1IF_15210, partial [Corynebacterium striatum]
LTGETRLRFWALAGQPPAVVPTNRKQAVPRSRNRGTNYPRSALNHDPGDELMVDWSGDGMVVVDPVSGQRVTAHLFVASLPHSG